MIVGALAPAARACHVFARDPRCRCNHERGHMIPRALAVIVAELLIGGCSARSAMLPAGTNGGRADTVHYVAVRGGRNLSRTSTWTDPSGATVVRTQSPPDTGAVVLTHLRFDPRSGAPVWLRTTGIDARGRAVEERFENVRGVASWESSPESGRGAAVAGAIYFPTAHAKWEAILPGLLRAAGPASFLPRGRAWIEREGTFVVSRGAGRQQVTQYAVRGFFPLASERVWLDESARLFADGEIVRAGWESVLPVLRDSAESASAADRQRYIRTLRHVPRRPVVIRNARLYDAHTKTVVEGATVVVRDSTIVAVGRDALVRAPAGAEVIDARGRMLLPGLWDMHSHDYGDLRGEMLQLAGGVTTIRDILRDTLRAVRLAQRPGDEVAFAPNVVWAGVIDGAGGPRTAATSDSAARLLVRRYAELGASQIKIYGRLQRRFVPVVVAEARRLGLRVGGHLAAGMNTEEAIRAGYDEISHIANVLANFRGDSVYFTGVASLWRGMQNAAALDMESDSVGDLIRMLETNDVAVDATLAFVEPSIRVRAFRVRPYIAPVLHRLPPGWGRGYVGWTMIEPDSMAEVAAAGFANLKKLVRMLHAAGVQVLPGTDEIGGFTLHRELELYAEAGIPAADVLYLATLGAARVMGMDATLGSLAVGKRADMILVDGDPLRTMSDIGRVILTMKGGALYDPALLYRALAVGPCCPRLGIPSTR